MDELIPLLTAIEGHLQSIRTFLETGQKVQHFPRVPAEPEMLETKPAYGTDLAHVYRFYDATVTHDPRTRVATAAIHARYAQWCEAHGDTPVHPRTLIRAISGPRRKGNGFTWLLGLRLLPPQAPL